MKKAMREMGDSGRRTRARKVRGAALALVLAAGGLTGCDDGIRDEFRAAALGGIETGVNAIMDGLLEGIFTIAEPSPGEDPDDAAAGS
jgi:hypothetical protein